MLTAASRRSERVISPRVAGAAFDALAAEVRSGHGDAVGFLVLDFAEASWQAPLGRSERRFFAAQLRGRIFVLLRAAQGSRGAPLLWARVAALLCRLTQGVFEPGRARLACYVDDPIVTLSSSRLVRDRHVALVVYLWMALGFPLSFSKGQLGESVTWTSGQFRSEATNVVDVYGRRARTVITVRVKASITHETLLMTEGFLRQNVVSLRDLRAYAGKLAHISSLVSTLRPFLRNIWGALSDAGEGSPSRAPPGCAWTKQVEATLRFVQSFLREEHGPIERIFDSDSHRGIGEQIDVLTDASPWGLGALLVIDGAFFECIAGALTDEDFRRFGLAAGDCRGQQCWESLAILVALRHWAPRWRGRRFCLRVRSDSVTALTMLVSCRGTGASVNLIAREIALDLARSMYRPSVCEHIPSVSNKLPDLLSRLSEPGAPQALPRALSGARRARPEARTQAIFKTTGIFA